jgi:hypothetical protein
MTAPQLAASIWADIVATLEARKRRLYEEIRAYPTPIAGCDQQFNYLLDQQSRTTDELSRAKTLAAESLDASSGHQRAAAQLVHFLNSSRCLDDATKQALTLRLRQG